MSIEYGAIGFIGLGNMGSRIVPRIKEGGYRVVAYDIAQSSLEKVKAYGIEVAAAPEDLAKECEVIFFSLPDPKAVESVFLANKGITVPNNKKVKAIFDLSTIGYDASLKFYGIAQKAGIEYIDAPVSGGVGGAAKGTLSVMISGKREYYDKYKEILQIIGKNAKYVGDQPGLGQVMKLLNNLLSASALTLTSEVVALGVKAGLNPKIILDVLSVSSGVNSAVTDKFPRSVINRKFQFGFKTALMYKDLSLYSDLAKYFEYPLLGSANIIMLWRMANNELKDSDFTEIAKIFERTANVIIEDKE